MDFEGRTNLCYRIITGLTVVSYEEATFYIYDPTGPQLYELNSYYDEVLEKLLKNVPSENDLINILTEKGLWSEAKDKEIEEVQKTIKELRNELASLEFKSLEKQKVLDAIERGQIVLKTLTGTKMSLLTNSAEYQAKLEKYKRCLFLFTFNENKVRVWNSWQEFMKSPDKMLNRLVLSAFFNEDINEKTIREVARSDPWRGLWLTACKCGTLFDSPITHLTDYQRALVSWSNLYDSVFEHPDSPSSEIINNDILLDEWFNMQQEKRKGEKKSSDDVVNSLTKNSKIRGAKELFIVVDTPEDARKVYELNDGVTKGLITSRENLIKSKGVIAEQNLPDIKSGLMMDLNKMEISRRKNA